MAKFPKTLYFILAIVLTIVVFVICVSLGSTGFAVEGNIVSSIRLPRVIAVALIGASLSVCGAAMQGLLRNPLADGTTLGVSSGSSLGAVIGIVSFSSLFSQYDPLNGIFSVLLAMAGGLLSLLAHRYLSAERLCKDCSATLWQTEQLWECLREHRLEL